MKTLLIVFVVAFMLSPSVRNTTSSVLHYSANVIQQVK